jgi:cytidylate kinase
VATVKEVRNRITSLLRDMTKFGNLVVEGRDITTAVFPDSPARFYLTASAEARARRRRKEEVEKGIANQSEDEVKASLLARDAIDSTRRYAPLRKADGVIEVDSSDLTLEESVAAVMDALPF